MTKMAAQCKDGGSMTKMAAQWQRWRLNAKMAAQCKDGGPIQRWRLNAATTRWTLSVHQQLKSISRLWVAVHQQLDISAWLVCLLFIMSNFYLFLALLTWIQTCQLFQLSWLNADTWIFHRGSVLCAVYIVGKICICIMDVLGNSELREVYFFCTINIVCVTQVSM